MLEFFLTALLGVLGWLGWVAHRHPVGFRRIVGWLLPLTAGTMLAVTGLALFSIWIESEHIDIDRTWPEDRSLSMVQALLDLANKNLAAIHSTAGISLIAILALLAVALYLAFLTVLPWLLRDEQCDNEE